MQTSDGAGSSVDLNFRDCALKVLAALIGFFIVADLISHTLHFAFGFTSRESFGFIRLFDLNEEANIPTWFSSMLLMGCAALLFLIAAAKCANGDKWIWHWGLLGAIFVLLSLDEIASIHERTIDPLHGLFKLAPLFTNAWVLIAIPFLIVFLFIYSKFLLNLPRRAMWLFLLSGAIYVGGVVGIEMFSGLLKHAHGMEDARFALMTTVEESLEMIGLFVFIYSLTDYMAREGLVWRWSFAAKER
ncbi:MAG: hypothetical protein OEU46_01570 [Alphaproteobacteria bacterium]|nr:hypothetical protein [Alphaproteobacteria bacterium]